jgi:hypothetical protein
MRTKFFLILLMVNCSPNFIHSQSMKIIMNNGTTVVHNMGEIEKITFSNFTSINDQHEIDFMPDSTLSLSNYPNPFHSTTMINYFIPESGDVRIEINDLKGQKVRTFSIEKIPAGNYSFEWDGKNEEGQEAVSGLYIYSILYNGKIQRNKMLSIKK